MNFDALGFTVADGLVASICSALPLLIAPMSIDGRSGWRVISDAVKRLFRGIRDGL